MTRRSHRLAASLAVVSIMAVGCGSDDKPAPPHGPSVVRPPARQLLAFAGDQTVGVVDGTTVRTLDKVAPGTTLTALRWAADGRHLATLRSDDRGTQTLTLLDTVNGARHRWTGIETQSIKPTISGVNAATNGHGFDEYFPDGTSVSHDVDLALTARQRALHAKYGTRFGTVVTFAAPMDGTWLLAASVEELASEPDGKIELRQFDPAAGSTKLLKADLPQPDYVTAPAIDGDRIGWAVSTVEGDGLDSQCTGPSQKVQFSDGSSTSLPHERDYRWRILQLSLTAPAIDLVAYKTRPPFGEDSWQCAQADTGPRWLRFERGKWEVVAREVISAGRSADGRVAAVTGRFTDGSLTVADRAWFTDRTGKRTTLPAGVSRVAYSPWRPTALTAALTDGPALVPTMSVDAQGFGPLKLGMDVTQLRAATRTPLRLQVDQNGCGTLRPEDRHLADTLGVQGQIADGKLRQIVVRSKDLPIEKDKYGNADGDLQPGVRAIHPRGPRFRGVRPGNGAQRLYAVFGRPRSSVPWGSRGGLSQTYVTSSGTFSADVDGAGVIRRIAVPAKLGHC